MTHESHLIAQRLESLSHEEGEVVAELRGLEARRVEIQAERQELLVAAKVVARLLGIAPSVVASRSDDVPAKPDGLPTMPEMILSVLERDTSRAMEPKDIAEIIKVEWWPSVPVNNVASGCWRMKKQGKLRQDEGSSAYRVSQMDEAPEAVLLYGKTSEASEPARRMPGMSPAEGREAEPGGGP